MPKTNITTMTTFKQEQGRGLVNSNKLHKNDAEVKCKLCRSYLDNSNPQDDYELSLCSSCKTHPQSKVLAGNGTSQTSAMKAKPNTNINKRDFSVSDKGLIRQLHGHITPQQLLDIINQRLLNDRGSDVKQYSMDDLYSEINEITVNESIDAKDRASLRRLLSQARRDGTLASINEEIINDFAIVFSLNQKQVLSLKDIILTAKED